nr:hypothetical protein [Tanacetum cinerariifolium]
MSAKGKKIVGNSPVFIEHSRGAYTYEWSPKIAKGGRGKRVLAAASKDMIVYFLEPRSVWMHPRYFVPFSSDIYSLINHYTDAKDIWDNVKMLLEGSKLTKEYRESQLMQLNSKFVNNMFPEWGISVTAMKLNRGLRDSNYDQLYAYLNQHEHYPQSSTTLPSIYVQPHLADTTQLDLGLSPTDNLIENLTNTLALLTQSYKTYLPQTNNQLRTSLNPRNQATIQDDKVVIQNVQGRRNRGEGNNAQGAGAAGYGGAQNRVGFANPEYFKDKMLLMQAQKNRVKLDEERLVFIAGGQDNVVDDDVDEQPIKDLALNVDNVFQADDYDAFDSDV